MALNTASVASKSKNNAWVPDGFVPVVGPDGNNYLVPGFMVPALKQEYQATQKKDVNAMGASGTVS